MTKKVTFQRPKAATPEKWVQEPAPEAPKGRTKRLTVPVSAELHRRLKLTCVAEDKVMTDVVRELLERAFPDVKK